jgi:UDP-glucose 4-epimerase
MILITGGLGFIGCHTARALLDLGESCILTRHRQTRLPEFLSADLGKRVFVEPLDVADRKAFLELGSRYKITGIVHLASAGGDGPDTFDAIQTHTTSLVNALRAARAWSVARISIASSLAVYQGVPGSVYREDPPLPTTPTEPVPVLKKSAELAGALAAVAEGLDVVNLRLSTIWGPLRRHNEPPFSAIPDLVHRRRTSGKHEASPSENVYRDDGRDLCYVKDCAHGIALLQLAQTLRHRTYNVADGHATTNADVVAAIAAALPDTAIDVAFGHDPHGPGHAACLDITRLRTDTGYEPTYRLNAGIADYVAWLDAGHEY